MSGRLSALYQHQRRETIVVSTEALEKTMDAVLGTPFSNSTFRFFEKATGQGHFDARDRHGYYASLYAPLSPAAEALTSALIVIFEKTWITAWDHPIPGDQVAGAKRHDAYWIPELGMTVDWRPFRFSSQKYDFYGQFRGHEKELAEALAIPVPAGDLFPLLNAMAADIVTALDNNASLVCGEEWRESYTRLGNFLADKSPMDLECLNSLLSSGTLVGKGLGAYSEVCGLTVNSEEFSVFAELRETHEIRKYSDLFVARLQDAGSIDRLFDSLGQARQSSELAHKATDLFSAASSVTSVASLIPGIGTITGAISLGMDATSRAADKRSHQTAWYALGPEIRRYESEIRLKQYLDSRDAEREKD
jgi:hypothetical protein